MDFFLKLFFIVSIAGFQSNFSFAQQGCTDPLANNYDAEARINNGSCNYNPQSITLSNKRNLPVTLKENSGLTFTDGNLWTHNDGNNAAAIYRINQTSGAIEQAVTISNAVNQDWEAISSDQQYIYIGDFGNNVNGNRTNLRIYRILKSELGSGTESSVEAEIIYFSYQDQVIQNPVTNGANNTAYDCEAFFVKDNTIHLFTKDWINRRTTHYTIPNNPGTHVAVPIESYNVNGLITDASIASNGEIALAGYESNLAVLFIWLLSDYQGNHFFSGNKRRIGAGFSLTYGQMEGICFTDGLNGFVSSEGIDNPPFVVGAGFYPISLGSFVSLPVNLISFTARREGDQVLLNWRTASEKDNNHFIIERSELANQFYSIGEVKGSGNSTTPTSYRFADKNPMPGKTFYRLKQVDNDGSAAICKTVEIGAGRTGLAASLYPNPVRTGSISIQTRNREKTEFTIYDLLGRPLKKGLIQNEIQHVSISNLQSGTYFLKLDTGETLRFRKENN